MLSCVIILLTDLWHRQMLQPDFSTWRVPLWPWVQPLPATLQPVWVLSHWWWRPLEEVVSGEWEWPPRAFWSQVYLWSPCQHVWSRLSGQQILSYLARRRRKGHLWILTCIFISLALSRLVVLTLVFIPLAIMQILLWLNSLLQLSLQWVLGFTGARQS